VSLRAPENRFVARDELVAERVEALRGGRSCVLVGPPGVGKTRLAAECVRRLSDEDEAIVVDLAGARDLAALLARVADAVALWRSPGTPEDELAARLLRALAGRRPGVLVLDDFEQLPPAADELVALWIDASPLGLLVTSRRRIACSAEHVELHPLESGDRGAGPWSAAATLLRARAAEVAQVTIGEDDRDAVHALAARLDGLPLALELGAAKLAVLTPAQLLARLDRRLTTLDGLAAALETSYALLDEPARALLVACSTFEGAIALEALEAVAGGDVLAPLATLRDHSLVAIERRDDHFSYSLAHSVRQFVRERAGVTLAPFRDRHAHHFATAAEGELAEIRAAFEWSVGRDAELAARLALALAQPLRGLPYRDVIALTTRALEASLPDALLGDLLFRRGTARRFVSDFAGADEDLERSRALGEAAGNLALAADSLAGLGNNHSGRADWEGARRCLEGALALHPSPLFRASALAMIANTFSNEDAYDEAEPLLREAIAAAEQHHDAYADAFARLSLGILLVERGDFDEAFSCLVDSLAIFESSRSAPVMQARHLRAVALTHLARVRQETGDGAQALADYHEALAFAEETGVRRAQAFALHGLASLLLELGELSAADDRIRAALPLMRETGRDAEGAIVALQGVLFALRGAHGDAERFFRRAEALLRAHKRPVFTVALDVLRGHDPRGTPYDAYGDVKLARRLRARMGMPASAPREAAPLFVAHDAAFFRSPDAPEQVSLARRKAVRAVLRALVAARLERPGVAISVEALVAAGWPGEKVLPAAGAERVYAAIATLRRLGLRAFIAQEDDGYLLRADRAVLIHEPRP
jgi:predicted ATPase